MNSRRLWRRPKQTPKTMREGQRIRTWKVQKMLQAGKKKEMTDELINGIYIQRLYKKSDGMGVGGRIEENRSYCAVERENTGRNGIDFTKARPSIMGFEPRSKTIWRLRIKTHFCTTTVISVYVATETADQERLDSCMSICPLCATLYQNMVL